MPKDLSYINEKYGKRLPCFVVLLFLILYPLSRAEAQSLDQLHFGMRLGLKMSTLTGIEDAGMELGFTAGAGARYELSGNSSVLAELLYSTGGKSSSTTVSDFNDNIKIYDKIHLHYLKIPIVYQYYFTDILGLEIGPQLGFCLGGKMKTKTGNEDWSAARLTSDDYHVFDFGVLTGIYTNNLTSGNDFIVSLRACFGFTNVMRDECGNKNVCIQLGIAYIIGK
ncbi:MAG: PorT family protein [Bacteroidales bacterium]|nr:PorT family protein [Bacteroidales bacterium]